MQLFFFIEVMGRFMGKPCRTLPYKVLYGGRVMERDVTKVEFVGMLQNGQRHFHKIYVEAGNFHGFDLSDLTFEECIFAVDFTGSNFKNTRLTKSNFKTCNFSNCVFKDAILVGNSLDGAIFKGAYIEGITFFEIH